MEQLALDEQARRDMAGAPGLYFHIDFESRHVRLVVDARDSGEAARLRVWAAPLAGEIAETVAALLETWCAR
jgi:hypothetical protein